MDNFRSNRCPPIVASTATPSPSSNAAQAARRQSRAPEFVPAPPIVNLNSMINDARQLEDVRLQLAAQAEQIKLLQRQIFIERSTSSKRSFGRDPVLSRRIQKEYQAFKDQNGVAFDFSVPPSEGDNRIVIDGMLPSLLDFNANRRRISDPQQRLSFVAEITHRIKKHRESLKAAQKIAETRTAEELLEDARLSMLKGRKKRKIQRRQEAFDAMGSTLPLPRQCPSHDMLKKYIFDFEIISDDEDDTMDMIGSKATRWISVQPSFGFYTTGQSSLPAT